MDWPEQQEYICRWCGSSELDYRIDTEKPLTRCYFGAHQKTWVFVKAQRGFDIEVYLPVEKTAPYLPITLGKPPEVEEVVVDPLMRVLPLETWKREEVVVIYPAKARNRLVVFLEDLELLSNTPAAIYNIRTKTWVWDGFLIFFKDGSVFEKGLTLADIL